MQVSTPEDSPIILFKYGGNAMINEDLQSRVIQSICSLRNLNYKIVIVHGGGPFIKQALADAGIQSEFIDGQRVTSLQALEHVEMALKGKVNGRIVNLINKYGYSAVGLSGKDGHFVYAQKRVQYNTVNGKQEQVDLGHVGDVKSINTRLIDLLLANDFIPVITCIASDEKGGQYNINADMFAGHLAGALRAKYYVVLTDVDGLLGKIDDPASLIKDLKISDIPELVQDGTIAGGMIPKVESCVLALEKGAKTAIIINETKPELLSGFINNRTSGTTIRS